MWKYFYRAGEHRKKGKYSLCRAKDQEHMHHPEPTRWEGPTLKNLVEWIFTALVQTDADDLRVGGETIAFETVLTLFFVPSPSCIPTD